MHAINSRSRRTGALRCLPAGLLLLGVAACTAGAPRSAGIQASSRLVTSYILTTLQPAIADFEILRDYVCDPARKQIELCQRAERIRSALLTAQAQLTRFLGGDLDKDAAAPMPGWPF
jgi:hypothetical protein